MEQENVSNIFLNMSTTKTASLSTYYTYVHYIFRHINQKFSFNNSRTAIKRLYLYQGVQRARSEMTNILINGGKKYNKAKRKNTKKNRKKRKRRRKRLKKEEEKKNKKGKEKATT
jgi:hypothetical protein